MSAPLPLPPEITLPQGLAERFCAAAAAWGYDPAKLLTDALTKFVHLHYATPTSGKRVGDLKRPAPAPRLFRLSESAVRILEEQMTKRRTHASAIVEGLLLDLHM